MTDSDVEAQYEDDTGQRNLVKRHGVGGAMRNTGFSNMLFR